MRKYSAPGHLKGVSAMNAIVYFQEGVFRFGGFELVPARRLLARHGRAVKVGSRAFDLLIVLVENAGQVVGKHELISCVWGNLIVEDTNLRVHISRLRRIFGDDSRESRYIAHVARRGYMFVAPLDCGRFRTTQTKDTYYDVAHSHH
jgi:DNA-binding winged helix-turn-helix (wHTH) protein